MIFFIILGISMMVSILKGEYFLPLKVSYLQENYAQSDYSAYTWKRFLELVSLSEGKEFIVVKENPEVIICFTSMVNEQLLAKNIPLILLDRGDSGSLSFKARDLLRYSQVKGIFKNHTLYPLSLYNEPVSNGCYHFNLINKYAQLMPQILLRPLLSYELNKIYNVTWDIPSSSCEFALFMRDNVEENLNKHRPIDIFFAGRSSFDNVLLYKWHRERAIDVIKSIQRINSVIITGDHLLPFSEYMEKMNNAKIVVSPWGLGEWCYRDIEAIVAGAILVKPYSDFLSTSPAVYQSSKTYVSCSSDFSDLKQKVDHILANYDDYKAMRLYAREALFSTTYTQEELSAYFFKAVRLALDKQ